MSAKISHQNYYLLLSSGRDLSFVSYFSQTQVTGHFIQQQTEMLML